MQAWYIRRHINMKHTYNTFTWRIHITNIHDSAAAMQNLKHSPGTVTHHHHHRRRRHHQHHHHHHHHQHRITNIIKLSFPTSPTGCPVLPPISFHWGGRGINSCFLWMYITRTYTLLTLTTLITLICQIDHVTYNRPFANGIYIILLLPMTMTMRMVKY